ncbi:hypothetical protein H2198_009219, partial [Neophaeococcomyces mojaviensis]
MSYKHRWIELSQNVDRDEDNRHWGIISCLTPSGMPWESRRGGPVSGKEVLALQGIPAHKLQLNKETSRQLQDLTGNAMTTTVVGAVMFSAIIASMKTSARTRGYGPLEKDDSMLEYFRGVPELQLDTTTQALQTDDLLVNSKRSQWFITQTRENNVNPQTFILRDFENIAKRTMQLCRCEGPTNRATAGIKICTECGHTCCAACAGNPLHEYLHHKNSGVQKKDIYMPAIMRSGRRAPADFMEYVRNHFPIAIDMAAEDDLLSQLEDDLMVGNNADIRETSHIYYDAIRNALCGTFVFSGVKRDKIWRVVYESEHGRLEMHIQFSNTFQLLQDLSYEEEEGLGYAWEEAWENVEVNCVWCLFAKPDSKLPAGSPVRKVLLDPTAMMTLNQNTDLLKGKWLFNDFHKQTVMLEIKEEGHFKPAWEATLGLTNPVFRNAMAGEFVSIEVAADRDDIDKDTLALITGKFRRLPKCGAANGLLYKKDDDGEEKFENYLFLDPAPYGNPTHDYMVFADTHERLPVGVSRKARAMLPAGWRPMQLPPKDKVQCTVMAVWSSKPGLSVKASTTAARAKVWECVPSSMRSVKPSDCRKYSPGLICELPHAEHVKTTRCAGRAYPIRFIDQTTALKELQWLLKPACKLDMMDRWHELRYNEEAEQECPCAPAPPLLEWKLAKKPGGNGLIIKPFEHKEQAVAREVKLKQVPEPVKAQLHCREDSDTLAVDLNLGTLSHRVRAGIKHIAGDETCLQWRIASDNRLTDVPKFPTLQIAGYDNISKKEQELDPDKLLTEAEQGGKFFKDGLTLYRRQKWTLDWMRSIERGRRNWYEWDRQEVALPALDWRVDVEGYKKVDVRSGVLADEVGGGKTITTLALINSTTDHDDLTPEVSEGTLQLKTTLILVPENIIGQWEGEMKRFVDGLLKFKVIRKWSDLQELTIQDITRTNIILAPWHIFKDEAYWNAVRKLGLAFNVPKFSGRAFEQWLSEAVADMSQLASSAGAKCVQSDWSQLEHHILNLRASLEQSATEKYGRMFKAFRREQTNSKGSNVMFREV